MGMSRRHKLLAQYGYADARGTLATFYTPFCAHCSPGLTIYGRSVQHGTPAPTAPMAIESVTMTGAKLARCGTNLFDLDNAARNVDFGGVANAYPTKQPDGFDIRLTNTGDNSRLVLIIPSSKFRPSTRYVLAYESTAPVQRVAIGEVISLGSTAGYSKYYRSTATAPHLFTVSSITRPYLCFYLYVNSASTGSDTIQITNIQVSAALAPYAPYNGQIIDLSGIGALGGVGDVRDMLCWTGQKWLLTRRTGEIASYSGEVIPGAYISTTGALTDGATVRYVLAAPIVTEVDLPAPVYIKGENTLWVTGGGVVPEIEARYLVHG